VHAASVTIAMAAGMVTNCRIGPFLYEAAAMMLAQPHSSSQTSVLHVRFAGLPQSMST
jgi:hypothetical protein